MSDLRIVAQSTQGLPWSGEVKIRSRDQGEMWRLHKREGQAFPRVDTATKHAL